MLILRRKEGQWVEIRHRSGDVIRVRVCNIRSRFSGQADLVLDDPAHNFLIQRPERLARPAGVPVLGPSAIPTDPIAVPATPAGML